jgi:hypothetical protein
VKTLDFLGIAAPQMRQMRQKNGVGKTPRFAVSPNEIGPSA